MGIAYYSIAYGEENGTVLGARWKEMMNSVITQAV